MCDTRRLFITDGSASMYDNEGVCCFNIKQAWCFINDDKDLQAIKNIANKYNVDIKLFGYECGMEFSEEVIAVHNRDTLKIVNNTKSYEDWNWGCPFPNMGG